MNSKHAERHEAEAGDTEQQSAVGLMLQRAQNAGETDRFSRIGIVGGKAEKGADHQENGGARQNAERPERDRPGPGHQPCIEAAAIGRADDLHHQADRDADECRAR